uniref:TLDc domain-containing protein n=2 Tax=Guillardia theta TaxID=55529 RepID=A0A7S4L149_GUITH
MATSENQSGVDDAQIKSSESSQDAAAALQRNEEKPAQHIVQSGETLAGIAIRYGTNVSDLKKLNRLLCSDLYAGQGLQLPVNQMAAEKIAKKNEASSAAADDGGTDEATCIYDTVAVWDRESGFLSLRAEQEVHEGQKVPCTIVGSLFTPVQDMLLSKISIFLRLVMGDTLEFKVVVRIWNGHRQRDVSKSMAGLVETACGNPEEVLFSSSVLTIQRQGTDEPVYEGFVVECDPSANSHDSADLSMFARAQSSWGLHLSANKTVLIGISTEGIQQSPQSEAQVGYVRRHVAGPILHKLVWVNGKQETEKGLRRRFDSTDHTIAAMLVTHSAPCRPHPIVLTLDSNEKLIGAEEVDFELEDEAAVQHVLEVASSNETLCLQEEMLQGVLDQHELSIDDAPLFVGRNDEDEMIGVCSDIISWPQDVFQLSESLPRRCSQCDWELLYSTKRNGLSMNTFFRLVTGRRDTIMLIKDSGGSAFGAFIPFPWKQSKDFYGTGESFVFRMKPTLELFKWGGNDSMFALTNHQGILIGGSGSPAIWIDSDFNRGTSGANKTYRSRCLASDESFTCIHLEVWATLQNTHQSMAFLLNRKDILLQMMIDHQKALSITLRKSSSTSSLSDVQQSHPPAQAAEAEREEKVEREEEVHETRLDGQPTSSPPDDTETSQEHQQPRPLGSHQRPKAKWTGEEVPLDGKSDVFTDVATGEWIVGLKVKVNLLQEHLHISYRRCKWQMLYSSAIHGASCATLLRCAKGRSPCFLLIKDMNSHVFGAFLPTPLVSQKQHYGDQNCFIFSLHPSFRVYGSKGTNTHFLLSSEKGISFGGLVSGSGSSAGIGLDSDLLQGTSEACITYGNPGTLASSETFACWNVEVWALVRPAAETFTDSVDAASLLGKFT